MNKELAYINKEVYEPCQLKVNQLLIEHEGAEYKACRFNLNKLSVICRNAKVTPKKPGLFVTFWKRDMDNNTAPFRDTDAINFFVVNVSFNTTCGQFVFPKSILIKKGIISSDNSGGKRGFRVYPPNLNLTSKQAKQTQEWQSDFYFQTNTPVDLTKAKALYQNK